MKVLVACEMSGAVRDAFLARGHDALSCDLVPSETPGPHRVGDVLEILDRGWDMMIAFPPCTDICVSGAKHFWKKRERQEEAVEFFYKLLRAPVPRIAIENPVSVVSTKLCRPTQIIQPWEFGDEAQKRTCLWLRWLPLLVPTKIVGRGEFITTPKGKRLPRWYSDNTDPVNRSRTFGGIAEAMADQWGGMS